MSSGKSVTLCRICGKTDRRASFVDIFEYRFTLEGSDEETALNDAMYQLTGVEVCSIVFVYAFQTFEIYSKVLWIKRLWLVSMCFCFVFAFNWPFMFMNENNDCLLNGISPQWWCFVFNRIGQYAGSRVAIFSFQSHPIRTNSVIWTLEISQMSRMSAPNAP